MESNENKISELSKENLFLREKLEKLKIENKQKDEEILALKDAIKERYKSDQVNSMKIYDIEKEYLLKIAKINKDLDNARNLRTNLLVFIHILIIVLLYNIFDIPFGE